jgi:hypothetical protein
MEDLSAEERGVIDEMVSEAIRISAGGAVALEGNSSAARDQVLLTMSTLNEEGVMAVKQVCWRGLRGPGSEHCNRNQVLGVVVVGASFALKIGIRRDVECSARWFGWHWDGNLLPSG